MPTELKEPKVGVDFQPAFHSNHDERKRLPAIVRAASQRRSAVDHEAVRRAKNIADAKARDSRIKERAAAKAKQQQRAIKPAFEAA